MVDKVNLKNSETVIELDIEKEYLERGQLLADER